jgi:hypothetical protein
VVYPILPVSLQVYVISIGNSHDFLFRCVAKVPAFDTGHGDFYDARDGGLSVTIVWNSRKGR